MNPIEPLIGGLRHETFQEISIRATNSIEPLIGGLRLLPANTATFHGTPIEPLIGGLTYPRGNEQLVMRN